ncbi:Hypothetical protein KFL_000140270 [Klebsormidium nitens]|uniref:BFN domain-containing protein n=1 Tax=Klebsormidium nitens TaxID=105231 RepID=A0A1Y1HRP6_KLENI|nr:Hypothetical protein KFL_000140270 [Klebsormidium nitens]|eukprot:GAQ78508.1 Hypothetical protein KFL_000140270 [Klebsormidium nitens]
MALNDNQGSSGEDMLHADEDFREAAVIDASRIFYHAAVPTIFLKMEASDLVLPIVVNGQASQMLTQALKKETGARPTMYEVIREMCATTKMEVKMVRVTGRVVDTYHARIYLAQANSNEIVSVDAKPSDAINIAVACNVKIFVNKNLMESDGVIPEYKTVWTDLAGHGFARLLPDARLDVADNQHDPLAEEIILIKNMSIAANEERYADAARWRDELQKFRTKNKSRRLHRQV